ncbi:tripartite tricarboxylate transporter TctB family protein [Chloroflexota bacterium]
MRFTPTTIFLLVIAAILAVLFFVSLEYTAEAKLFPFIIMGITALLIVGLIIREALSHGKNEDVPQVKETTRTGIPLRYLSAPAWFAAFLMMVYLVGYLVTAPLFVFLYLKLHRERWLLSLILAALALAAIYGGFTLGLGMDLYRGILFT